MSSPYLSIYLQDHHAGAVGGVELAKRAADANRGSEFERPLGALLVEIRQDREALVDVMRRLNISTSAWKNTALWAAEKVGRLKLNGRLTGYSPLSRVLELEALRAGVLSKLAMWRTLRGLKPRLDALAAVDVDRLIARAEDQTRRLDELHERASALIAGDAANRRAGT